MRIRLGKFYGQRKNYTADLGRISYRRRGKDRALLLNVCDDTGEYLADHVWVAATKELHDMPLGSKVEFSAVVRDYCKRCGDTDYELVDIEFR